VASLHAGTDRPGRPRWPIVGDHRRSGPGDAATLRGRDVPRWKVPTP